MVGIPLRWGRAEPLVEVAGSGHIGVDLLVMPCFSGNGFIEEEARDGDVVRQLAGSGVWGVWRSFSNSWH
jgi:hypothetical protein